MGCCISRIEHTAWASWYDRACLRLSDESAWRSLENKADFLNRLDIYLPHQLDAVYEPCLETDAKPRDMRVSGKTIEGVLFTLSLDSAGIMRCDMVDTQHTLK
jgi:hypothetical protein